MSTDHAIRGYYLATPVFLLLEFVFDLDLRVSPFIGDPRWRLVYYVLCFGCMTIILLKPALLVAVGLFECSLNIVVLFVGAALTWMFPFIPESPDEIEIFFRENPATLTSVVNFLIVGGMWIVCFHRRMMLLSLER